MTVGTEFTGFRPAAFEFFEKLRDNNNPTWFNPRKPIYEAEVLGPFRGLVTAVSGALQRAGLPLTGDPRRNIFRIYRDVRFSPDKRRYKTHAGAVLTRSGEKHDAGLLYLHFEPGASMIAAGFWRPAPTLLAKLRRAIVADPDAFLSVAADLEKAGHPIASEQKLARLPRGFETAAGSPIAAYLGWKSFTVHAPLCDAALRSPSIVGGIVEFAHCVMPLLEWGWAAIGDDTPPAIKIGPPVHPLPKPDF